MTDVRNVSNVKAQQSRECPHILDKFTVGQNPSGLGNTGLNKNSVIDR